MRRWSTNLMICSYLGVLLYGLTVHALKINPYDSMGNYFVVWDMYCGWTTYEKRGMLIAEGESGRYYDVSPPWNELRPFGSAERHDYDDWGLYNGFVAANILKQTEHEPIVQLMLIEQHWSKKYNLPDKLWSMRFDEPKTPQVYYYLRSLFETDGTPIARHFDWKSNLAFHSIIENPELRSTVARSQPYLGADEIYRPSTGSIQQASFESPGRLVK